jgi:SNF2 family DNA or RNA helicase
MVVSPRARVWSEAVDQIGSAPVTILTYESLQNEDVHDAVCGLDVEWLVLEEAHNLKKRHTHNKKENEDGKEIRTDTKSGLARSLPGRRRIAVTGTPMPQRWHEVWTLLNFVAPNVFTSFWQFVEGIGDVSVNFWGGKEISHEILRPEIWDAIFDRWIILRDRSHARQTVWDFVPIELSDVEKKAYRQMQKEMRALKENGEMLDAPNQLAQATRLEQLAGGLGIWNTSYHGDGRLRSTYLPASPSSKTEVLLDMLSGLQRAVVFTRFRKRAEYVAERVSLDLPETEAILITGGVSEAETTKRLSEFKDTTKFPDPQVAICVFGTISEGVNELVSAQDIFFLDWSTTKDVAQAADRLDRPGQKGLVRAVTLYAVGTIDEITIDRESFKMVPIREALKTPDAWSFLLDPIDSKHTVG